MSLEDYHREEIYSIINYEGQILPPFMEDMDEYLHCIEEIAKCNHIVALEDEEDIEYMEEEKEEERKEEEPLPMPVVEDAEVKSELQQTVTNFMQLIEDKSVEPP